MKLRMTSTLQTTINQTGMLDISSEGGLQGGFHARTGGVVAEDRLGFALGRMAGQAKLKRRVERPDRAELRVRVATAGDGVTAQEVVRQHRLEAKPVVQREARTDLGVEAAVIVAECLVLAVIGYGCGRWM